MMRAFARTYLPLRFLGLIGAIGIIGIGWSTKRQHARAFAQEYCVAYSLACTPIAYIWFNLHMILRKLPNSAHAYIREYPEDGKYIKGVKFLA